MYPNYFYIRYHVSTFNILKFTTPLALYNKVKLPPHLSGVLLYEIKCIGYKMLIIYLENSYPTTINFVFKLL